MRLLMAMSMLGLFVQIYGKKVVQEKKVNDVERMKLTFHSVPSLEEIAEITGEEKAQPAKGIPDAKEIISAAEESMSFPLS